MVDVESGGLKVVRNPECHEHHQSCRHTELLEDGSGSSPLRNGAPDRRSDDESLIESLAAGPPRPQGKQLALVQGPPVLAGQWNARDQGHLLPAGLRDDL